MKLADLAGRRVAVWGPGVEGIALAAAAVRLAPPEHLSFLADDPDAVPGSVRDQLASLGADLRPVGDWAGVDMLVHTAGVSRYRPEIAGAAGRGVALTTPTALWFADHEARRVIAVTGSKGKSTTTALIGHLVDGLGEQAAVAGNIGDPLGDLYCIEDPAMRFVVEVSSHQTADLDTSPEVAVVTNLSPDHLPWHDGDVEIYYRDKLRLLANRPGMISVLNAAGAELATRAAAAPHPRWYGRPPGYHVVGDLVTGPVGDVAVEGDLRLRGSFNLENCCAALSAVAAAGLQADAGRLGELLASFAPLPGRLDVVARRHGVEFVDDALASNPAGAVAAVGAFGGRPLTLIVGGSDRLVSFAGLAACLAERPGGVRLVTVPDNGAVIAAAVEAARPGIAVDEAADVAAAVQLAAAITPRGGVVLFAPAAPTPGRLGDYRDRSRSFRAAVKELAS